MQFCEGRPSRGARPLTSGERAALASAARRATWRSVLALLGLGAPFAAFAFTVWLLVGLLDVDRAVVGPALAVLGLLALLGGFPVAIMLARDSVRAALALRRDRRRAEALVFGDGDEALAILPASRRVVGRGVAAVRPDEEVEIGEAVPAPDAPATYALAAADVPEELRAGGWVKRALSPGEREEAIRHAERLARLSRPLVAISVLFAAAVAAKLTGGGERGPARPGVAGVLSGVAWSVLIGLGWLRTLRRRGTAARLREDADDGWAHRGTADGVEVELLPHSGAPWTAAGAPAAWRLERRS